MGTLLSHTDVESKECSLYASSLTYQETTYTFFYQPDERWILVYENNQLIRTGHRNCIGPIFIGQELLLVYSDFSWLVAFNIILLQEEAKL